MLISPSSSPPGRPARAHLLTIWALPFAWAILIFILSSLPGGAIPSPFFSADKVFHLGVYAVLGYLVARALASYGWKGPIILGLSALICFLYGISDELHQWFVPERTPSFIDAAADTVGSCIGIVIRTCKR